ncbi:MAG: RDD family protein [Deltaproteobacteria bacterium]|nr:RDD family protein [Deltaproteobacteria bacterium]
MSRKHFQEILSSTISSDDYMVISASGLKRTAAFLVDFLLFLPFMYFGWIFTTMHFKGASVEHQSLAWYDQISIILASSPGMFAAGCMSIVTTFSLLRFLCSVSWGKTPGMYLSGIRYHFSGGGKLSPVRMFFREILSMTLTMFLMSTWIWAFFDEGFRPLHDKISGVFLISEER